MLGGIAGISGWLMQRELVVAAGALLIAAAAVIVAAYVAASRHDVDATTEVAALVVLAAGVLAGLGSFTLASGTIAFLSALLVEKSHLHSLVARIDAAALRAAMRFAVMALVVLPLLPAGPYGPFGGVRPRELWALVLFFSGLSFVGHVARQVAGPGQGYIVTGLVGGLISSTHVTLTFARLSREHRSAEYELALGAVAANAVLFPRVLVVTAILNPSLLVSLSSAIVVPAAIAIGVTVVGLLRQTGKVDGPLPHGNPLQLRNALQMSALFQCVLISVHLVRVLWSTTGIMMSAAVLGVTDVDALVLSMARDVADSVSADVATTALVVGITSNTLLKAVFALLLGTPGFRLVAVSTLAPIAALLGVMLVM